MIRIALVTLCAAVFTGVAAAAPPPLLHPESLHAKAPAVYRVAFVTTKGQFVVTVHRAWSPLGADRFYNLVRARFFDGVTFFRVVKGFVVQFGISPDPAVSRAWQNATIKDDPVKASNAPGTITFADGGPNTRTTQVFLNLGSNARLDTQGFSPFGRVTSGMGSSASSTADTATSRRTTSRRSRPKGTRSSASSSRSSTTLLRPASPVDRVRLYATRIRDGAPLNGGLGLRALRPMSPVQR